MAGLRYDPLGRLYEVTDGASGAVTRFVHDGDALVMEYSGTTVLRRYVHGANAGVDDPVARYEGASLTTPALAFLLRDRLGSINAVAGTDHSVTLNRYDEYGIPQNTNQGRFQYTGQAWLGELGMYYYKARVYSPTLGRFMQVDPVGYEDQVNLYAYVGNDPVNGVDPSGMMVMGNTCSRVGSSGCSGVYSGDKGMGDGQQVGRQGHANATDRPRQPPGSDSRGIGDNGGPPLDGDGIGKKILQSIAGIAGRLGGTLVSLAWSSPTSATDDMRKRLDLNAAQNGHMFRDAPGHYPEMTARALREIDQEANAGRYYGRDGYGNDWFGRVNSDGSQTWVKVRGNRITDAGINQKPEDLTNRLRFPK